MQEKSNRSQDSRSDKRINHPHTNNYKVSLPSTNADNNPNLQNHILNRSLNNEFELELSNRLNYKKLN